MRGYEESSHNQISMVDGNYLSKFNLNTIKSIHLLDDDKELDREIIVDLKHIINKYRKLAWLFLHNKYKSKHPKWFEVLGVVKRFHGCDGRCLANFEEVATTQRYSVLLDLVVLLLTVRRSMNEDVRSGVMVGGPKELVQHFLVVLYLELALLDLLLGSLDVLLLAG